MQEPTNTTPGGQTSVPKVLGTLPAGPCRPCSMLLRKSICIVLDDDVHDDTITTLQITTIFTTHYHDQTTYITLS